MNDYLFPIKQAFFTFPFLAFALTIPFLIVQYRKYGYVNKLRAVILYSLLLYSITAYYLVILPLPKVIDNCTGYGSIWSYMQLQPFSFVSDIARETNFAWNSMSSYVALLQERSFLQVIFNVVLMIPLGIFLRYYFRFRLIGTAFIAFLVSLFYETTQVTGLYGFYSCPYRLFDVDDLILNTSGVIIGFIVAPILNYLLPRSDKLDEKVNLNEVKVGLIRRGISFAIDMFVLMIVSSVIYIILYGSGSIALGTTPDSASFWMIASGIAVLIYFVAFPAMFGGRTLGKWITRIHIVEDNKRDTKGFISWKGLLKRYALLYFGIFGTIRLLVFISDYGDIPIEAVVGIRIIIFMVVLVFAVHIVWSMLKGDKLLFYERISGTRNVVTTVSKSEEQVELPTSDAGIIPSEDTIASLIEAERNNQSKQQERTEKHQRVDNRSENLHTKDVQTEAAVDDNSHFNHSVPELHERESNDQSKQVDIELEKLKKKLAQAKKDE
ncbi:permease [Paenibacillus sp. L3-i20]|nr:permease [Paenibacillus sp. L3-i20]